MSKNIKIRTVGYHDMFSVSAGKLENLTAIEINGKTIIIEAPAHITASMPNIKGLTSQSEITKVDALIITHADADHIAGLDSLIWHKFFAEGSKLLLITHKEVADQLWQRIKTAFETDRIDMRTKRNFEYYMDFIELQFGKTTEIEQFGIGIETFKRSTRHSPFISLAFRILKDGIPFLAYSGDTSFDLELIDFLGNDSNCAIIHEAGSYAIENEAHTHIEELLSLPNNIQKRMFINHIPNTLEEMINKRIEENKSPIRTANKI